MSITINSNIASLNAQRRFAKSTDTLSDSFTRLSSGLRINRAKDDASGLAISAGLDVDARIFAQGVRNFNDGASLLNIAEGALNEHSTIVIRLRELSTQSANGTLGKAQRKALEAEAQALSKEFTRIARTTKFNGVSIFDADFGVLSLQGGYGQTGGITSSLGGAIGTGMFAPRTTFSAGASPGNPWAVAVGDFNADGKQDMAVAEDGVGGNSVNVLLGNGDGSFRARTSLGAANGARSIELGDFNGDGVLDLAVAEVAAWTSIFLGRGDGSFGTRATFVAAQEPYSIEVGDFNNDGFQDLVLNDISATAVSVLLGNGNGSFKARASYATNAFGRSVTVGDFNGDGVEDLATTDTYDNSVSVLLGNGNGSFKARVTYTAGANPDSLISGDFNGDGVNDLAATAYADNALSVLLGNGNGSFKSRTLYTIGNNPGSLTAGDFNGDGIPDVAVGGFADNITTLFGNGDGSFRLGNVFATGADPYSVSAADFNGDGVQDLVTADTLDSTVSILLARTSPGASPLLPFSLKYRHEALQAMAQLDQALTRINSQRGAIGAFQSRLQTGINNLHSAREGATAAKSRIVDVDVAHESAELVRANILQQAGAAILGQANQAPELALLLLS